MFEFLGNKNPRIEADDGSFLKFYLTKKDLQDYELFSEFVKDVKKLVRGSERYINYKKSLYELGLNRCQVLSNLPVDSCDIEMHHHIFTLADDIAIITDHVSEEVKFIDCFDIADIVLKAHEKNMIPFVMLSETVHEMIENDNAFIPFNGVFGKTNEFITKYHNGLRKEHYETLLEYLELSKKYKSTDSGLLELIERVGKYVKK